MKFHVSHLFALAVLLTWSPAPAADLSIPQPPQHVDQEALRAFVTDDVLLLQIRALFDVIDPEDIQSQALADARLASGSYLGEVSEAVRRDLEAEGSYYIVSLSYLVAAGGANWPIDRSSLTYERDAAVHLEEAKRAWVGSFSSEPDTTSRLSILENVDVVNAWTEGETQATGDLDHFADTESLVNEVLASL